MLNSIIIYEDNHLLIVLKPPGFLAQPDGSPRPDILTWAEKYLARHKPGRAYVGLVHRLDMVAGGVMVLAKTSKAASRLSFQFRERLVKKLYLAAVPGQPPTPEGLLEQSLVRMGDFTRLARPGEKGNTAILKWRNVDFPVGTEFFSVETEDFPVGKALLEVELITGFKHQIRAQMAAMGLPLVGDTKYGGSPPPGTVPNPAIGLWASSLSLDHPTRSERMIFTAPLPNGWPWSLFITQRMLPSGLPAGA